MQHKYYPIAAGVDLPGGGAEEVGNKAWNLMRMAAAGLPVPPGFVLPTGWCRQFRAGQADEAALQAVLADGIAALGTATGLGFGAARHPLLISVRSGAAVSMPGMMETVLDVGLNAQVVDGLIRQTGNPRLAWDSYRRLVQGYAEVVEGLPTEPFDARVRAAVAKANVGTERELDYRSLRDLTQALLAQFQALTGRAFPQDPNEQLLHVAAAVFRSWDAPKAASYRRLNGLDDAAGTAVTVQAMVFGNAGGTSGAGVAFTPEPGDWCAGPLSRLSVQWPGRGRRGRPAEPARLRAPAPAVARGLEPAGTERARFGGVVQGRPGFRVHPAIWNPVPAQARNAKRTPWAALRIAVDLVDEGLVAPQEALAKLQGIDLSTLVRTRFGEHESPAVGHGAVASLGVAAGVIAFDQAAVERLGRAARPSFWSGGKPRRRMSRASPGQRAS